MKRILLASAFLFFAAAFTRAESLAKNTAEAVLNAFIATYAKSEVAWKKDIRLNEIPGRIEAGRQLGQSAITGYYSFIPKLWSDLSNDEQMRVLKDPRLRAFLTSSRVGSTYPASGTGQALFPIEGAVPTTANRAVDAPASPTGPLPGPSPQGAATSTSAGDPIMIQVRPGDVIRGDPLQVKAK